MLAPLPLTAYLLVPDLSLQVQLLFWPLPDSLTFAVRFWQLFLTWPPTFSQIDLRKDLHF